MNKSRSTKSFWVAMFRCLAVYVPLVAVSIVLATHKVYDPGFEVMIMPATFIFVLVVDAYADYLHKKYTGNPPWFPDGPKRLFRWISKSSKKGRGSNWSSCYKNPAPQGA